MKFKFNTNMLLNIAKNNHFLQEFVIRIVSSIHPSIEHNLDKIEILKKAFWHSELEKIEGAYFEFGVYEGASLFTAIQNYQKLRSPIKRHFYGFDSFDDGFKYFDERDRHPFFKEGDFVSSYSKVIERFKKFDNVSFVKGYFEETIAGKSAKEVFPGEECSIIFIDCDFMSPTLVALEFMKSILKPGSIIILDDYWAYKGDPERGTCGALSNFLKKNPTIKVRDYYNYGHGGKSFMVYNV